MKAEWYWIIFNDYLVDQENFFGRDFLIISVNWPSPLERVTVFGLEKWLSVCPTPLYLKNWTLLDFHTCTFSEVATTSTRLYLLYHTRSYWKGSARHGFFQSSRLFLHLMKHEFYIITGCRNDSFFQQSKLESLNMCTLKVTKLTNVSCNTCP